MVGNLISRQVVSVIIPCYNAEAFIEETIASVLAQTWPNVQIIVVDDGSTDSSWKKIRSFRGRIEAIQQPNSGGCCARNVGFLAANGSFIMFLDADDLLEPNTLEHLVMALGGKKDGIAACSWENLEWCGTHWVAVDSGLPSTPPGGDFLLGWLSGWYIPPCALLWSRESYERTGGWDERLLANQDGDIVMRALADGAPIHLIEKGKAYYRQHDKKRMTVSTQRSSPVLRSRIQVLEKITIRLRERRLLSHYAVAVGQSYHLLARDNLRTDLSLAQECIKRSKAFGGRKAVVGSWSHRLFCSLLGLERKEGFVELLRRGNGWKK